MPQFLFPVQVSLNSQLYPSAYLIALLVSHLKDIQAQYTQNRISNLCSKPTLSPTSQIMAILVFQLLRQKSLESTFPLLFNSYSPPI